MPYLTQGVAYHDIAGQTLAAIVVKVVSEDVVNLFVMDDGAFNRSSKYKSSVHRGTEENQWSEVELSIEMKKGRK